VIRFKFIYSATQPTTSTVGPARSYDEPEIPADDEEFKEDLLSERPFFYYASCNWYEHVVLEDDSALEALGDARYTAVIDISKQTFRARFLPLAE
ncbi:hypothetical protein LX36DRAFT_552275, partial [Colletotrichum falcatum]